MEEIFDEARKDGGDHAEGEHVESDGKEDKGCGCSAAFGGMGSEGFVKSDEFGLGHQRIGCRELPGRVGRLLRHGD